MKYASTKKLSRIASLMMASAAVGLLGSASAIAAGPGKTYTFPGMRVDVSAPILVDSSTSSLVVPSLARLSDGSLLMTAASEVGFPNAPDGYAGVNAFSTDGGKTWSAPVPGIYSQDKFALPSKDEILLPYTLLATADPGVLAADYSMVPRGQQTVVQGPGQVTVSGFTRPLGPNQPKLNRAGFFFVGQVMRTADGHYLTTMWGWFAGDATTTLFTVRSQDGLNWTFGSVIAGPSVSATVEGADKDSTLVRLKDGKLMCIFRVGRATVTTSVPYLQSWSSDDGITWTPPVPLPGLESIQPNLARLNHGLLALSSGLPGLGLSFDQDGTGVNWDTIDILALHNAAQPGNAIGSSSFHTGLVAVDGSHVVMTYDQSATGGFAAARTGTNNVWAVIATVHTKSHGKGSGDSNDDGDDNGDND